jgi:hypothetical protein
MVQKYHILGGFWYCSLNSGLSPGVTTPAQYFVIGFLEIFSWTICLGWLKTAILLVSASWVAGIAGVSHQYPEISHFLNQTSIETNSHVFVVMETYMLNQLFKKHEGALLHEILTLFLGNYHSYCAILFRII